MNKIFAAILLLLFATSCSKDNNSDDGNGFFPPVQVYLSINLLLPSAGPLNQPQGYIYENGGNKGIIVYRTITNDFVAFDRTCPHNPGDACSYVSVDSNATTFRCGQYNPNWKPCCNSRFDASTGTPIEGAANRSLRGYYCRVDGNTLYVSSTP